MLNKRFVIIETSVYLCFFLSAIGLIAKKQFILINCCLIITVIKYFLLISAIYE
jgi:hypothetical protein